MLEDFFATLSPGDRIVVRYRLGDDASGHGGPALTDALGEFAGLQEGTATQEGAGGREATVAVRTRNGLVLIALATVTHAKRGPPPPARRRPRPSGAPLQ
jgi:hypothetical protein